MVLFSGLFGKQDRKAASKIYAWALARAQQHCANRFDAPSKTKDDRRIKFEAISLFMAVAYHSLIKEKQFKLAQYAMEEMFTSFDDALREQGVSDLKVAKEIRVLSGAFNGRLSSYEAGIIEADKALLAEAIKSNKAAENKEVKSLSAAVIGSLGDIKSVMPKNNA